MRLGRLNQAQACSARFTHSEPQFGRSPAISRLSRSWIIGRL